MAGEAPRSPDYLATVRAYADAMIERGRDTYGEVHSPLFAGALDRRSGRLLEGEALSRTRRIGHGAWGIRPNDRTLTGANPMHHENLYQVLYALSEVSGDPRYSREADAALAWFFGHCQSPTTGLMAWGEHMGWDFWKEGPIRDIHEFFRPWVLSSRSFDLTPEPFLGLARGLWEHQIHDRVSGEFSRHARFSKHGTGGNHEFPRHGGFYIAVWAEAYRHTKDPVFLTAMRTLVDYFDSCRSSQSGGIPAESHKRFQGKMLWGTSNLSLAVDLWEAADMVPEDLAAAMRTSASKTDKVFLRIPHDLSPGGPGFQMRSHVDTLEANPHSGHSHTSMWAAAYSQSTDALVATLCVTRYRQVELPGYRRLILAAADRYMTDSPGVDAVLWPGTLGHVIGLLVASAEISGDKKYLDRADHFARLAMAAFFDDTSPLPKASSKHDHYEAITRADTLMMSLLMLWKARHCPEAQWSLAFTDR